MTIQPTAVFKVPVTDALNCCVAPVEIVALAGLTVTPTTGTTVALAEADMVGFATLVTVTLTLAGEGATEGAE